MTFNSYAFLAFFIIFYFLYVALPKRARVILLLVSSYYFYSYSDYRFIFLVLFSTVVDFFAALWISSTESPKVRKVVLASSLSITLAILALFKYSGLVISFLNGLLSLFPTDRRIPAPDLILPVGISFYTFQTMSYTIDVYRRAMPPCRKFSTFANFVIAFPQLVAGPIVRASQFVPQVHKLKSPTIYNFNSGFPLIFWGLFKKVLIADTLAYQIVDRVYNNLAMHSIYDIALATYCFAFQIYCDFSGYSDIAIGLGRILGFKFPLNFRFPYFASSMPDFWKRWHISLSTWFRDYLYIPLGGNRNGPTRQAVNILITMALAGLWHGAQWNFLIWGLYHAYFLCRYHRQSKTVSPSPISPFRYGLQKLKTFHIVLLGWVFFRCTSFSDLITILAKMPGLASYYSMFRFGKILPPLLLILSLILIEAYAQKHNLYRKFCLTQPWIKATCYTILIITMIIWGTDIGKQFIYFRF